MTVNAGARLDRLPLSPFHRRVLSLIGVGMFFDGFDVYVAATVLGATLKTGPEPAESYGRNLENLITHVRQDVGVSDLPFIMVQVGSGKVVEALFA